MPKPPGEWDYLYRTTPVTQLPWELGGPDVCLERLVQERMIPAKSTIVDFGCGVGSAAVYLAALGHTVVGIDLSQAAIQKAQQKAAQVGVAVDFRVADALNTGLKRGLFDGIYDRGCLEHLSSESWAAYRTEVQRLLKPGGVYITEVSQDKISLDELKSILGTNFSLVEATGATHLDRPTNIPRYYTMAVFKRAGVKRSTGGKR